MSVRSRRAAAPGVELGLDDDAPADDVQATGEPQHRGDLGLAAAGLGDHRAAPARPSPPPSSPCADPATRRGCVAERQPPDAPGHAPAGRRRRPTSATTSSAPRRPLHRPPQRRGGPCTAATGRRGRRRAAAPGRARPAPRGGSPARSRRSRPAAGARLRTTHPCARRGRRSASASSGTSRCGSTLVNHEPGPSTTQSASSTAATASAQAGGSCGHEATRRRPGRAGRDRDLAADLDSRVRVGSGRRPATAPRSRAGPPPSAAPGPGRRAAGRPSPGRRPVVQRLPQRGDEQVADRVAGRSPVAAEPVLDHVAPGAAPVVVAAQRGQRHPQVAGRQDADLARSRPLEPPSSETLTTAVSWPVTCRSAGSDAARPCPPPSATTAAGPVGRVGCGRGGRLTSRCRRSRSLGPGRGGRRGLDPPRSRRRGPRPSRRCGACRRCSRRRP